MNNHHILTASSMATIGQPISASHVKEAAAFSGLDLLVAASQVESKPTAVTEDESASNEVNDEAPSSDCDEKPTIDAPNCKDNKPFPQVLQEILNTPEYQSIAHWLPDGLSFIISNKQRFSDEIIPKHFRRVAKIDSFIRNLRRYGFRRVKNPREGEESSFAHIDFVREKPWLCSKMKKNFKPTQQEVPPASAKQNAHVQVASSLDNAATREKPWLCDSKPTYHKAPSAKQNRNHKQIYQKSPSTKQTHVQVANSLGNAALPASTIAPQSFLTAGRIMDTSRINVPSISLPTGRSTLPVAVDPLPTSTAAANAAATAIQERHLLASYIPEHLRQLLILQRHQRQVQLQRLLEIFTHSHQQLLSYQVAKQRRPQADIDIAAIERADYEEPSKKRRRRNE